MDPTYGNALRRMVTDPNSFQGTPGFQFALNTGLDNVSRQMAARGMNNSGNTLGELTKFGTGLAMEDYGNQMDRLGRLTGQEQQYDLGQGQLGLGRDRLALDDRLGTGQLDLGRGRLNLDAELGRGQLGLGRDRLGLDRDLGMGRLSLDTTRAANEYDLGLGQNENTRTRNQYDYTLGLGANENTRTANQNTFNLGMFNAQTNRGNALRDTYYMGRAATPETYRAGGAFVTRAPQYGR